MIELVNVLVATLAAFVLGAVWYAVLSRPWMADAGIPVDADGKPEGGAGGRIFAIAFVLQVLVAGMMRHIFAMSGISGIGLGLVAGLGIGLFFISPWIALNNLYAMRPARLTLIDGGYATLACGVMGLVLTLF